MILSIIGYLKASSIKHNASIIGSIPKDRYTLIEQSPFFIFVQVHIVVYSNKTFHMSIICASITIGNFQ